MTDTFYKQPSTATHPEIVRSITAFLGSEVLRYMPYRDELVEELVRVANRPCNFREPSGQSGSD